MPDLSKVDTTAIPTRRCVHEGDRRNLSHRNALTARLRCAFEVVPGLSLTAPQASRLFGVPVEICRRVMTALARDGAIQMRRDGCYVQRT